MQRAGHQRSPSIRATALMSPVRNPAAVSGAWRMSAMMNEARAVPFVSTTRRTAAPGKKPLKLSLRSELWAAYPGACGT